MNDLEWVKILRFVFRVSRKDYCFFKKSMSSYYYIDRLSEFIVVPVASTKTGKVENVPPDVFVVTADYSIKKACNVPHVVDRFLEYMEKKGFSL